MMNTKQLSLFIENRVGRANEVVEMLSNAGINILCFTLADSAEFGILRLIVSDVEKATKLLKEAHISVLLTDVMWIPLEDRVGALNEVLRDLANKNISIQYMYVCYSQGQPYVIVRV